ncbi:MAG: hypothetical protein R2862_01260 [Thermoanaerobaculia bacterium]
MRIDAVSTVAKREYLTRVKSKGFWIATLLLPIAMAALTILPSMIAMKAKASHRLALVDEVGGLGEKIASELERSKKDTPVEGVAEAATRNVERADVTVELVPLASDRTAMRTELDRRVLAGEIDSWLWISDQGLAENEVEYHAESVSNFITQGLLERWSRAWSPKCLPALASTPGRSPSSPTMSTSRRSGSRLKGAARRAAWWASSSPTSSLPALTWWVMPTASR